MRKICKVRFLSILVMLFVFGATTSSYADNLNRLLMGSYGSIGGTFHCIDAPIGGIDPITFVLLADVTQSTTYDRITIGFDGEGNFSFISHGGAILVLTTTAVSVGDQPVDTVGGAPVVADGTYNVNPDRSFSFEYTISIDLGPDRITSTAFRGEGFIGPEGHMIAMGIVEPQVRTFFLNDVVPLFEQLCGWGITAVELKVDDDDSDSDSDSDSDD